MLAESRSGNTSTFARPATGLAGALRRAVIDGDVENGSLMAGQSVGMVTAEQPVKDILAELVDQAVAALAERAHVVSAEKPRPRIEVAS